MGNELKTGSKTEINFTMKLDFTGTEAQNPDTELTIEYLFRFFWDDTGFVLSENT